MKTFTVCWFGLIAICLFYSPAKSQTITGAWKGKIGSANTELKLIKRAIAC